MGELKKVSVRVLARPPPPRCGARAEDAPILFALLGSVRACLTPTSDHAARRLLESSPAQAALRASGPMEEEFQDDDDERIVLPSSTVEDEDEDELEDFDDDAAASNYKRPRLEGPPSGGDGGAVGAAPVKNEQQVKHEQPAQGPVLSCANAAPATLTSEKVLEEV